MSAPTPDDINRLEKAAWDAGVELTLIWYRDQRDELLAACKLILDAEPFPPNVGAKFTRAQRAVEAAIAKAEGR